MLSTIVWCAVVSWVAMKTVTWTLSCTCHRESHGRMPWDIHTHLPLVAAWMMIVATDHQRLWRNWYDCETQLKCSTEIAHSESLDTDLHHRSSCASLWYQQVRVYARRKVCHYDGWASLPQLSRTWWTVGWVVPYPRSCSTTFVLEQSCPALKFLLELSQSSSTDFAYYQVSMIMWFDFVRLLV